MTADTNHSSWPKRAADALPTTSDDVVEYVGTAAKLPPEQAALAVEGMLSFLAARLPSPLFSQLQLKVCGTSGADSWSTGDAARDSTGRPPSGDKPFPD